MKVGDLVQVNIPRAQRAPHHGKIGIVMGRVVRHEPGKHPLVRVLLNNNTHLFDYCSLDVVNESR